MIFGSGHELTHVEFADGHMTPACTCGWWSPSRRHSEFEEHVRRMAQREQAEVGWREHTE